MESDLDDRSTLSAALSAYFATRRFTSLSNAYVQAAAVPGLLLWLDAWHPMPGLVVWLAVLTWGGCASLALCLAVLAWRGHETFVDSLPATRWMARLHVTPLSRPAASGVLFHLLLAVTALLWTHALVPAALPPTLTRTGVLGWPVLLGLSLVARILEAVF